jgi:hypothetical protein
MDKIKLEKAVTLLHEGVKRFPTDTPILDLYTDLLIQLGEHDKAKEVSFLKLTRFFQLIKKSVALNPDRDGRKYLNMAEMLDSQEAVQVYRTGI